MTDIDGNPIPDDHCPVHTDTPEPCQQRHIGDIGTGGLW